LPTGVPVSIACSGTFNATPPARTMRTMSGRGVFECVLECLLECLLEFFHIVQSPHLLHHRNKAAMALAVRDFGPGWKFVRHLATPHWR
jgi:hypothetical protein